MKFTIDGDNIHVELTRRNLTTLLMKLDLPDGVSERTITITDEHEQTLYVTAVHDDEHYAERPAGEMHPREEAALRKPATGTKLHWKLP